MMDTQVESFSQHRPLLFGILRWEIAKRARVRFSRRASSHDLRDYLPRSSPVSFGSVSARGWRPEHRILIYEKHCLP